MPIQTPICDFGQKAYNFKLKSTDNKILSLNDIKGENGTLIMFICNHCPYVKGIKAVAISSNDVRNYPEDSFDNMIKFSNNYKFNFPYLFDETQEVAKSYNAVCTPDFFGYNKNLKLEYRGRIRELKNLAPVRNGESDLSKAMKQIVETDKGPKEQISSMGCSIKWFNK